MKIKTLSRPNHDFCHFVVDFKEFSLGAGWNAKTQCFSFTPLIANHLNLKYIRRPVMAEWITHLTKDVVRPVRVSLDPSYKLSTHEC